MISLTSLFKMIVDFNNVNYDSILGSLNSESRKKVMDIVENDELTREEIVEKLSNLEKKL